MEHLPEDIIQHILSYLERNEAIQVGVVCKKLYSAWSLHPVLKLHHDEVYSHVKKHEKEVREEFMNYVNKSLERYLSHSLIPQQLHLTMNCERYSSASSMIAKLLQKFEEAGVGAIRVFYTSTNERYSAVTNLFRVLECKKIVEFKVESCNLIMKKKRIGKIKCNLLKRLILRDLLTDDDTIQSIISSCPLIEKLDIQNCYNLRTIKVVNHYCLKEIDFDFARYRETNEVEVGQVPSLESLFLQNVGILRGLELFPYLNMKTLSLLRVPVADSFFQDFSSKFPNLENFSAINCIGYKGGNISGNSLKYVTLKSSCKDTRQPEINAPNLVCFIYECSEIPCFVSTISSSIICECKLKIKMESLLVHGSDSFFIKLKETLKRLINSKLSLYISFDSISNIENLEWSLSNASESSDDEPGVGVGVEVEDLTLYKTKTEDVTWASSRTYSSFVDSLFWICRPKSICLYRFAQMFVDFDMEFGKVFCERLMDRRSKSKSKFGWENDLKGVKIEIEKIDWININRETQVVSIEDWRMLGEIRSQLLLGKPRKNIIAFFIRLKW